VTLAQPFLVFNPEAALYTETETLKEHGKKVAKEKKALEKYTEYPAHGDVHRRRPLPGARKAHRSSSLELRHNGRCAGPPL